MGMDAELLAIGKFSKDIVWFLEYPDHFYSDVPEGSNIITRVCTCATSMESELLAEALGISPWKFEEHCNIDGANVVDLNKLDEAMEDSSQLANFIGLHDAGFQFYYMPNG